MYEVQNAELVQLVKRLMLRFSVFVWLQNVFKPVEAVTRAELAAHLAWVTQRSRDRPRKQTWEQSLLGMQAEGSRCLQPSDVQHWAEY